MADERQLKVQRASLLRDFDVNVRQSDVSVLEREIARGKIMEAALQTIREGLGGADPAAISIVFGLKW